MAAQLLNEKSQSEDDGAVELEQGLNSEPEQPKVESEYAAKSREELEKMIADQKEFIGRQSAEVGSTRAEIAALKSADQFIQGQLAKSQPEQPKEELDYFSDPAGAISKSIVDNPELKNVKAELDRLKMAEIKRSLEASHPDYLNVLGSKDFTDWISVSPTRRASFKIMDQSFDLEIANDLLQGFKESNQTEVQTEPVKTRKESVKAASSGNVSGSSEVARGKKVRSSDLREMMINDPKRYSDLMPEIMKAYQEGRVINS
jgi:hypothetical protein